MNPYILSKLSEWRQSPLLFVTECIQAKPSDQQAEVLISFAKNKRTTIRSGHGCGKSTTAAWLIMWFLCTRPYAKVACTAPTARQLSDILWSELSKWLRQSILADEFVVQKDKIFHKSAPKEWWARAISPSVKAGKDEQAETLAGLHGDHLLIVCDEASGIPDPVYVPLEGALTQEDNKVLLIGNPTKNKGYFYDTHFDPSISKNWNRLHWDSRNSSNVTKEMVQYFMNKYGLDSNVFRIRVAGEPPLEDEKTLIPLHWAQQCVDSGVTCDPDDPLFLGVDVARYGDDKSIILPRQGLVISPWQTFQSMNTHTLGGFINQSYQDYEASGLAIDEIGVGAGVTDYLMKLGHLKCFGVNVAESSSDKMRYARLRDELWWKVREKCRKGMYNFPNDLIPRDDGVMMRMGDELANELSTPLYDYDQNNAIKVESKKDMKARGIPSPNIADALCLTEYFESVAIQVFGNAKAKKKLRENRHPGGEQSNTIGQYSWMFQ